MLPTDRRSYRRAYIEAWKKHLEQHPLEPFESMIVSVIEKHPEYHPLLAQESESALDADYLPESGKENPFLHMGMHIGLHEQLQTDRPNGLRALYLKLSTSMGGDQHSAEHQIMECLGATLWQAQRDNKPPDEQAYLNCIRQLI